MSDPVPVQTAPENVFTPEEIAQLETAYRRVAIVTSEDGAYSYAIKPADKLQWKAFRAKAADADERAGAQETLVTATIIACAYDGQKTLDAKEARAMLENKLLKDWVGATDGPAVYKLVQSLNMGQGAARAK